MSTIQVWLNEKWYWVMVIRGFPGDAVVKNLPGNAGDETQEI